MNRLLLLPLLLLPAIEGAPGEDGSAGLVVAAPHEGFDDDTGPLARELAAELGWGCVVASGYRSSAAGRWIDVNRPTSRPWTGEGFGSRVESRVAVEVYGRYQQELFTAGRVEAGGRLDLLVEIHGHSRRVSVKGESQLLLAIEGATQGFEPGELRKLQRRYRSLLRRSELPEEARVPLFFDALDPEYTYRGETIRYYFGASGAKAAGSLSERRTRRALHFELPRFIRVEPELRAEYVRIFAELLRELAEGLPQGEPEPVQEQEQE